MKSTEGKVYFRARHLARELIDMVIDYLHADKNSLLSCSCVCKDWTLSARYHLFRTIFVPLVYTGSIPLSLESLGEFLANHPDEASFIKAFTVRGYPGRASARVKSDPYFFLQESVVASVLSKLLAVRSVSLTCLGLHADNTNIFSALALLPHLRSISLCDMRLYDTESIGPCAVPKALVPRLEHIHLVENVLDNDRLRNFLDIFSGRMELDQLAITLPWRNLHPPLYAEILTTSGTSLTYLDLDIRPWCIESHLECRVDQDDRLADRTPCIRYFEGLFGSLHFSSLTRLARLDLRICAFTEQYAWMAMSVILDMIPRSAPLNQIVISLDESDNSIFGLVCEPVIRMFGQAVIRLPHIRKVTFTGTHSTLRYPRMSSLADHMPILEESGILVLQESRW